MTVHKHTVRMLALAGVITLPVFTSGAAQDESAAHHPPQAQTSASAQAQDAPLSVQERRQVMRQRMQEIRATQDPERRRQLLEAQMKDLEAWLDAGTCPAPGSGGMAGMMRGGMVGGMMARGMQSGGACAQPTQQSMGDMGTPGGMGCGMRMRGMQQGMCGQGQPWPDEVLLKRMEALEKRVDLIQTMLQMQAP